MERWNTRQIIGFMIILFSVGLFIDIVTGGNSVLFSMIIPLLLLYIGRRFSRRGKQSASYIFYAIGGILLIGLIFSSAAFGFVLSGLLLLFGYRLYKNRPVESKIRTPLRQEQAFSFGMKESGHYVLRDTNEFFLLRDVEMDLSQAIIPEGETFLLLNGLAGDIRILIPAGYDYSIDASIGFGKVQVDDSNYSPVFNRRFYTASDDYVQATRKVRIHIVLMSGSVEVMTV
ncbi:cell wall-active antibiotics response protein LiaF [Exiguobacterium profundum]|uniref:Cell wall-active antibiotics response protein LiaF n=1 Tax=Exiguobacterium profundum TaxID=307643 RepID=A0ABY8AY44_9BACL|nr:MULTISPECIES: cell wall-active antibiotics response protein LiaF [Exiguobacterium]WED54735.1 cell wall-active antibiotics response protein LiaF [Exiguobacterium profundum]